MTVNIFSTLSNDQSYTFYKKEGGSTNVERSIFIAGKANVANKHLITPSGMATSVSDEDYADLQNNEVFNLHVKNGFLSVSKVKADPEKVAKGMTSKDESAPKTEKDFAKPPKVVKSDKE